jgi:hypothetical protein
MPKLFGLLAGGAGFVLTPRTQHTVGKVPAGTGSPKMAFEEASRLLNPSWRDGSTPVAPLSTALVQRA